MAYVADFAIYDHGGRLFALVEAKSKQRTTTEWAADFQKSIYERGLEKSPELLLLVTPDKIYVWKDPAKPRQSNLPDHVADTSTELGEYFTHADIKPEKITGPAFEMLVESWLNNLTYPTGGRLPEESWLAETGLSEAARDGRIEYQVGA